MERSGYSGNLFKSLKLIIFVTCVMGFSGCVAKNHYSDNFKNVQKYDLKTAVIINKYVSDYDLRKAGVVEWEQSQRRHYIDGKRIQYNSAWGRFSLKFRITDIFNLFFNNVNYFEEGSDFNKNDYDMIVQVSIKNFNHSYNLNEYNTKMNFSVEILFSDINQINIFRQTVFGEADNSISREYRNSYRKNNRNDWLLSGYLKAKGIVIDDLFVNLGHLLESQPNELIRHRDHIIAQRQNVNERNTLPAELVNSFQFIDKTSINPNKVIDSGENSLIISSISNQAKGTAFSVKLQAETKFPGISIPKEILVGDIQSGETKEVTIPVEADLSLQTGTASFLITAREKRGYDARPVELQVPTMALKKPELFVASCNLNDSSGLGQGDGDSLPENNETVELAPYIKNEGVGAGLKVLVELAEVTPGIEIVKGTDDLAVIEPGSLGKATLAFKVPRTFSGSEIKYTVVARDVRGMETSQTYTHSFSSSSPQLQYSYQVVDSRNREIPGLENGKSYTVRLTPKNIGNNIAEGVKVNIRANSNKVDIGSYSGAVGSLDSGSQGGSISIPVSLARSFTARVLELDVSIIQDSFPGFDQKISLPVKVTQPKLDYQVVLLNGVSDDTLTENSQPKFRVSVSNNGSLEAENIEINFQSSHRDASIDEKQVVGTIKAGESQYKDFTFRVLGGAKLGKLPIKVKVAQSDFDNHEEVVSFNIVKQTALVQKVEGTVYQGISVKGAYTGPPEVYINSPNSNVEVFDKTINLHGSIILFGTGNDIVDFKVSVNGKPLNVLIVTEDMKLGADRITRRKVEGNKIVFDGEVSLGPEMNEIKITCLDRNSQERSQILHVNKKAKLGNIYAVVVGVSEFANQSYFLGYAASDAKKFYDFLKSNQGGALPDNRIKLLTNYEATRAGIIAALTKFAGRAGKEDTVEIYLATHGLPGDDGVLYYLAYDTDINNLFGTGFSNNDFEKIVKDNIQAGRVVIYLDACHTGMAGLSSEMYAKRGVGVFEVNQKINALAAQLSKTATGVTTLSASSSTGYSLENKEWGGGVFTHSLIKGLNGEANENNDEWVNLDELENYLTREVFILTDGKQKPKVNGTLIGETTVLSKVK